MTAATQERPNRQTSRPAHEVVKGNIQCRFRRGATFDPAIEADWIRRFLANAGVRRDASQFIGSINPAYTLRAAEDLPNFGKPVLFIWAEEDRVFKIADAERLAAAIPGARLERVADSYSFVPEDQPARLAELLRDFVGST